MDYFLANPQILGKQPKRNLADMLQREGILVPQRYDSLADARHSGKPIFVRSEHPQDYAGVSGMLDSFRLNKLEGFGAINSDEELQNAAWYHNIKPDDHFNIDNMKGNGADMFDDYCAALGVDRTEERKNVSFSLWEHLDGVNRTVFKDPAIPEKYHIFSLIETAQEFTFSYAVVQKGITHVLAGQTIPEVDAINNSLVDMYNNIQQLHYFDSEICPIMEMQTVADQHYFLQYHHARKKTPVTHTIPHTYSPLNSRRADMVIGATSPEGVTVRTTLGYSPQATRTNLISEVDKPEDASFDFHHGRAFSELMFPKRKAQFVADFSVKYAMEKFAGNHLQVSRLAKPPLTIVFAENNANWLVKHPSVKDARDKDGRLTIDLLVVSDGQNAVISVVE